MWNAVWNILSELSPWLLLGATVAGLMHLLVPAARLQRLLRGLGSLLASVLVGIPLPLCSCSVIPVGIGLRKEGASRGASVGFLISTPQTGVDSILVSGSLLGWPFALFKVGAALVMGLVGGGLIQRFGQDGGDDPPATTDRKASEAAQLSIGLRISEAIWHSVELIRSIWRWLVIGVLVSACITWLMPADQLTGVAGTSGLPAMLITLVISLPLYVCATASVPIAAALVGSGLPAGAAMVFLMAGPATNLATLGAVFRTFGLRTTGLYLVTMVVGSITAGLLFDSFLPTQAVQLVTHHHHNHWFSTLCSCIVLGMVVWFALEDIRRLWPRKKVASDLTLRITGMNCENCASGLEREFKLVPGVDDAIVRFATEEARISGNPKIADITQIVNSKGFTVTSVLAQSPVANDVT
jgi:uncharacterized membrane protein YraQ (UPF0718 family)/copper chaperone CopZ